MDGRLINRPKVCGLLAAAMLMQTARGHDGDHPHETPRAVRPAELYRPTAAPDRICLSWTGEPATSMSVTWRTDTSVAKAVAEYAVATGGPDFRDHAVRVDAASQPLTTDLGDAKYHEALLPNLEPETKYLYRVGDGVNWSEWSEFQTASSETKPFSFVYFGDAQNDIKSHWSRVVRNAFRDAPRAAFFLHAGDLVNTAESDAEWGEWFYAGGFIHRTVPAVAVPGNHEMAKPHPKRIFGGRTLTQHWRPTFAFPENGPDKLPESCYYFDYQGVRFVCLNSNEYQRQQARWMRTVLADAPGWKIVTHHHPIYSAKAGRDNPTLRGLWQPIYDELGVDLVLQGHDHTYARSGLLRHSPEGEGWVAVGTENVTEGTNVRSDHGTVYVVSVSGPKMYKLNQREFMRSSAERTQLYQVITVDGQSIRYRACTATGRLYDAFELVRREGGPNELRELQNEEVVTPAP